MAAGLFTESEWAVQQSCLIEMTYTRLVFMLLAACPFSPAADTNTNPVGDKPVVIGDPFVLQHAGKYYLFGT